MVTRAGVAVWSAAPAGAAVSARGRDDDDGCAGPAASPARRLRSPVAHPAGSRVTWWRCDVERLNRLLRSGLTFHVEPDGGQGAPVFAGGGQPSLTRLAASECARPSPGGRSASSARGVLVMVLEDGRRRTAACSIPITDSERGRRLSISCGLSECAMALGLGTGVYRRQR